VSNGDSNKLCDYINDSILDACIESDPDAKVSLSTIAKRNYICVMGNVSCTSEIFYEQIVRKSVKEIGYDTMAKGLDFKSCHVTILVDHQTKESPKPKVIQEPTPYPEDRTSQSTTLKVISIPELQVKIFSFFNQQKLG
jgi:S-adenosylmethionine synthetase